MTDRRSARRHHPLVTRVVEGKPIRAGGRELVPEVRVTTHAHRRALVGADRLGGQGGGFVHMRPVAIVERGPSGERRIPIQDNTAQFLSGMLLAAAIIPMLLAGAVLLARRTRGRNAG